MEEFAGSKLGREGVLREALRLCIPGESLAYHIQALPRAGTDQGTFILFEPEAEAQTYNLKPMET